MAKPFSHEISSIGGAIRAATAAFREAGLATPALDARLIVSGACGISAEAVIVNAGDAIEAASKERLRDYVARRLDGEPVSKILGHKEFWGLTFLTSPRVLDPRPESEILIECVLAHVKGHSLGGAPLSILDLGTGSGCLLGALLTELPQAHGVAVDLSLDALEIAQENFRRLGLTGRASLLCANWAEAICAASFDIVVCNPPYIASGQIAHLSAEVQGYDPHLALDGGADGLEAYRKLIPGACAALKPRGFLILEIGRGQAESVRALLKNESDLGEPEVFLDLGGCERAVAAVRQSVPLE